MTATNYVPEWDLASRCVRARRHGGFGRQEDLATATEISSRTISRYESGRVTRPNRLVLRTWAQACGVSYEWLAGEWVARDSNPEPAESMLVAA